MEAGACGVGEWVALAVALFWSRTTRRPRPGTGLPIDNRSIFRHGHPWISHVGQCRRHVKTDPVSERED